MNKTQDYERKANVKTRIAIFGGGVGGLTVAHQLCQNNGNADYDITIYESTDAIGGLARSGRDADGCATEYCWRVFFGFYTNLFQLMQEIPLTNAPTNKTVLSNLALYRNINIVTNELSWLDTLRSAYEILYGSTSCDERLNELDNVSWYEALSKVKQLNILRQVGPWLGMDRYKGSYKSVIKVGMELNMMRHVLNGDVDFVTSQPTSEAWFNHWMQHLRSKGVSFKMKTSLQEIVLRNPDRIDHVIVSENGNHHMIKADHYVFALPVQALHSVLKNTQSKSSSSSSSFYKWNQLSRNLGILSTSCLHLQVAVQIYFSIPIRIKRNPDDSEYANSILLEDSPWDLIILFYDQLYTNNTKLCTRQTLNAKGGWSVAVCTAYRNGRLIQKPFNRCSWAEMKIEIWDQIMSNKKLHALIQQTTPGLVLNEDRIVHWSPLWPSFQYDHDGVLHTTEPKFTNNAGSWKLRPSFKTPAVNGSIATAYVQETIDIFSMEAACIAGKYVANDINSQQCEKPIMEPRPSIFKLFRALDKLMFHLQLPNIGPLCLGLLLLICFLLLTWFFLFQNQTVRAFVDLFLDAIDNLLFTTKMHHR